MSPKQGGFVPICSQLEQVISQFAARLTENFADQISPDPSAFKKRVLRLMRRALPPRPGRPNDPRLDAACRMIQQGNTVKQVLQVQVPDFDRLDTYGSYLAEKGLRAALARRLRITPHPK